MCDTAVNGLYVLQPVPHNGFPCWKRDEAEGGGIIYFSANPPARWFIDNDLDPERGYFAYVKNAASSPPSTGWREACGKNFIDGVQLSVTPAPLSAENCVAIAGAVLILPECTQAAAVDVACSLPCAEATAVAEARCFELPEVFRASVPPGWSALCEAAAGAVLSEVILNRLML